MEDTRQRQSRLDDERYLEWLTTGLVTLAPTSLTDVDHDYFYQRANSLYETVRTLRSPTAHLDVIGDNLRAQIPRLDDLLTDTAVDGALRSILGDDYLVHPHHFVHASSLKDQGFHQDGNLPWNERGHYRPHRPDWALLFYYPQDVTLANGPTEVVPGSQYWTIDIEKPDGDWRRGDQLEPAYRPDDPENEDLAHRDARVTKSLTNLGVPNLERRFVTVPKGTVAICSYDIVHRGSRATEGQAPRYMYKFYFARAHQPDDPSWTNERTEPPLANVRRELRPIVRQIWHWSRAAKVTHDRDESPVDDLKAELFEGREDQKVAAAYELAGIGAEEACTVLADGLGAEDEAVRRASCYGLRAIGEIGLEHLVRLADAERAGTRRMALFALGNAENGEDPGAVKVLVRHLVSDADDLARSNAAYALGQLLRFKGPHRAEIVDRLLDRLEPGVEPDNTDVAGLSRSTVRQSIAYALFQAAANDGLAAEHTERLAKHLDDGDRYVRGFVLEALRRQGRLQPTVVDVALDVLARDRFNPTPTPDGRADTPA